MIRQITRRNVRSLLAAGRRQTDIARLTGVSVSTVRRIAKASCDSVTLRERRIGRPSVVEDFRRLVADLLTREPGIASVEILERTRLYGYRGGKTAMYNLIASLRRSSEDSNPT